MSKKKLFIRFFLFMIAAGLLSAAAYGIFFIRKINRLERQIDVDSSSQSTFLETFKDLSSQEEIRLKGMEEGRINILLLGVAGDGKPGKFLSDTLMLASIDTRSNRVALMSVPRDLYVDVPEEGFATKINTIYQFGREKHKDDEKAAIEPIRLTFEEIAGQKVHYWAVLNFEGFQKAIDAIGGINIMNERDIFDPRYPGPNYSYETFELKKGLHHLDGTVALKYARMRHNDPQGDFGRAKRQQQVLQSTKNKIFSSGTYLNIVALNELFNVMGENIRTNIDRGEFGDFLRLLKRLDTENINNVVLDAWNPRSLLKVSHVYYGDLRSFVLIPRAGNWSEVQESSENIFDADALARKREEIGQENATVALINASGDTSLTAKIQKLLKDSFGYKNSFVLSAPGKASKEEKTFVYDFTGGQKPFTLDEIIKKLPAALSEDETPEKYQKALNSIETDLLIIIGTDLAEIYDMAEDSFEEYNNSSDANEYREFIKSD